MELRCAPPRDAGPGAPPPAAPPAALAATPAATLAPTAAAAAVLTVAAACCSSMPTALEPGLETLTKSRMSRPPGRMLNGGEGGNAGGGVGGAGGDGAGLMICCGPDPATAAFAHNVKADPSAAVIGIALRALVSSADPWLSFISVANAVASLVVMLTVTIVFLGFVEPPA